MQTLGKWIWTNDVYDGDEYGEFYREFEYGGGYAELKISVDGDYTLFVNGQFFECNQFSDFEHYKIYDTLDLSPLLQKGKNSIAVLVWHFGVNNARFFKASAGLWFELKENGKPLIVSDENTLCRTSRAYENHRKKNVTPQIGYGFAYDARKEDGWLLGELDGFTHASVQNKRCDLYPRPTEKHVLLPRINGKLVKREGNRLLFDLGKETVGLLQFSLFSEKEQEITFSYGEHIEDGWVRKVIEMRDFRLPYFAKKGENGYTNYVFRLACRYIEVESQSPIDLRCIGLLPQVYPIERAPAPALSGVDEQIYDTCVRTLELCMMEHYSDGPWREQAFYVFDSMNQMLCGYHAFKNGNFDYARANLLLYTKDRRPDGLLSICCPSGSKSAIPSFSLHFLPSVWLYTLYSGDHTLAREAYGKMREILTAFLNNKKDGLICGFKGLWNFYEWSPYSSGGLFEGQKQDQPDGYVNALTVIALKAFDKICQTIGMENPYLGEAEKIAQRAKQTFFREDDTAYALTEHGKEYTELGNALAILAGFLSEEQAEAVCEKMVKYEFSRCSLSCTLFKFSALLQTNEEKYRPFVFDEIRKTYGKMLEKGATSFWETERGADDFNKAGSLCHGWSAIPIYFYSKYFK